MIVLDFVYTISCQNICNSKLMVQEMLAVYNDMKFRSKLKPAKAIYLCALRLGEKKQQQACW